MDFHTRETSPALTPLRTTLLVLAAVAAFRMALHALGIDEYGYFRDELYYIASTRHLDFGFVDHPPFSIYVLAAWTALFGDSLAILRLAPLLIAGATVIVVGLAAREIGGGLWAQLLAPLVLAVSPLVLGSSNFFSMNVLDQFFWAASTLVFVRALRTGDERLWLLLGLLLGLGLFNKISVLLLIIGLVVGLLLTRHRAVLARRAPWIAAALALVLFTPYILWQVGHGFPTLEFMANATAQKMVHLSPVEFLSQQFLAINPLSLILYATGLAVFVPGSRLQRWRILPIAFLVVTVILIASGTSKSYYLAAAYPMLAVPGAVLAEALLQRPWRKILLGGYAVLLAASGCALAPFAIPILPPESYIGYARSLGVAPRGEERSATGALPQHFADMHGWTELVDSVNAVYARLSPQDQARCRIFGQNYGEAGAIDVLGRRLGLPPAMSGHNSYWYWGPGDWSGEVLIVIGSTREDLEEIFSSVEEAGRTRCSYCMPYENDRPIWIVRGLHGPVEALWQNTRMFI